MEYCYPGNSGLQVSRPGPCTDPFGRVLEEKTCQSLVDAFSDAEINLGLKNTVQITDRSLRPKRCAPGLNAWVYGPSSSSPGVHGRAGTRQSFIGKMRDAFLNMEMSDTLLEAGVLCAGWWREHNCQRRHSALSPSGTTGGRAIAASVCYSMLISMRKTITGSGTSNGGRSVRVEVS